MGAYTRSEIVQAIAKFTIGSSYVASEEVDVLDVYENKWTGKVEYLINYGGPIWVDSESLMDIRWIIE